MENPAKLAADACGSQYKLAKLLNIKPQAVNTWVKKGRIPAERVVAVERVSGVSRRVLRPDLYRPE